MFSIKENGSAVGKCSCLLGEETIRGNIFSQNRVFEFEKCGCLTMRCLSDGLSLLLSVDRDYPNCIANLQFRSLVDSKHCSAAVQYLQADHGQEEIIGREGFQESSLQPSST